MIIPPYLQKGDTIGIVCPSGYMPEEKAATCIQVLQQWGYQVKTGSTLGHQFHYSSGTDEERLADLQQMLDDRQVKAVLCARGGYGMSRIIDRIDFRKFRRHPKWLIGFSDITLLHAHVYEKFGIASLHAPMAAAFNDGEYANPFVQSLRKALRGNKARYSCTGNTLNRKGKAEGALVGGNLSLIAHAIGSSSSLKTKKKILFLEDVGEYIYNADRMMIQLKRSGMLDHLAGLIIGGFTEMKDTTIPFGADVYNVIAAHTREYDYPVCFGFPVSHEKENYALKVGAIYTLQVSGSRVSLQESPE
ncbi:MAG TPA: LD-carboxypeptidase [Sediminibacterium sp.]